MAIIEINGGPVTRKYLESKTKFDLSTMYLEALDHIRELEAQLAEANAENIEQARLLGMSADRELSLQARLSEANKAKDEGIEVMTDILKQDDAQAFKEARKWLAKHGGRG